MAKKGFNIILLNILSPALFTKFLLASFNQ